MGQLILNVDDFAAQRYLRSAVLRRAGFDVIEAATGEQALALAEERRPPVIVLDIHLPDLDGFQVCRRLKQNPATADILVFHVSATFVDPGARVQALDNGADGYLPEPLEPRELVAQVRALLRLHDLQQRLSLERAQLSAVYQAMTDGVWVFNMGGQLVLVNDVAARMCGFDSAAQMTPHLEALQVPFEFAELDRTPVAAADWPASRIIRGEVLAWHELRVRQRQTGEEWIIAHSGRRISDDLGGPPLALVISRDITAQKQVEASLRVSEEKAQQRAEELETVMDVVPAAIWVANDPECRTITGNRTANQFYEAAEGENVSAGPATGGQQDATRRFFSADVEIPPEGLPMQVAAATGREVRDTELDVLLPSGRTLTMLGSAAPLRRADGASRGAVAAFIDVTARKRAEQSVSDANARLEEADRRKDEFLAILSHELRNPLAPIRYALPVLQGQQLDERGTHALVVVQRQVEHLARLVDDLLDVSRIVKGKIELRREYVTAESILRAAADAAAPRITEGNHRLKVVAPERPVWLYGDPARLAQVVTNLVDNSAKYTPPGGDLLLELAVSGNDAVIRVCDNGIGIPPAALPGIFDMFQQVNGPGEMGGGLGIGLSLVKRLVQMHDGVVTAHSAGLGRGAEFQVRLPVAHIEHGPAPRSAEPMPSGARPMKVLIVDDSRDLVEMLTLTVESAGHEVQTALDGATAIATALAFRPEVVLLDLGLPGMSGLEVAAELRRQPELSGACLIALTGWGQPEHRRQTKEAGFDYHLTKPTDPEDLVRLLADLAAQPAR